jgi:hypothetical protein
MYLVIGTVAAYFTPAFFVAFWAMGESFIHMPQIMWPFLIGTLAGIIFDHFVLRNHETFETFEHELTHALVALLFFRSIKDFTVTRRGGQVWHSSGFGGEFGDTIIGLAPYFLPTFTLISAFIRPFLGRSAFPWFDVWIGLTFGYHLWSTVLEIRENWSYRTFVDVSGRTTHTDIGERGLLFSTIMIACLGLATHGITLALMTGGYRGIRGWWGHFGQGLKGVTIFLLQLLDTIIRKVS